MLIRVLVHLFVLTVHMLLCPACPSCTQRSYDVMMSNDDMMSNDVMMSNDDMLSNDE